MFIPTGSSIYFNRDSEGGREESGRVGTGAGVNKEIREEEKAEDQQRRKGENEE